AALTTASEVGDWRRFATARTFMGFTGLVPSEYSSGAECPPWTHHQSRQRSPAYPADRVGVGLPAPTHHRRGVAGPPAPPRPGHPGPLLGRTATPVRPVPPPVGA